MANSDYFDNRSTSAGYRLAMNARPRSAFPDTVPRAREQTMASTDKSTQASMADTGTTSPSRPLYRSRSAVPSLRVTQDAVVADRIWTQILDNENRRNKIWETHWGFTTQYDQMGRLKPIKELPAKASVYSQERANTTGGDYGSRMLTDSGQRLQSLEFSFYAVNRKRRLDNDLLCY